MEIFIKPEHLLVKTSAQLQAFKCTHYLILTTIRGVEAWPPLPKVCPLLLPGVTWEVSADGTIYDLVSVLHKGLSQTGLPRHTLISIRQL